MCDLSIRESSCEPVWFVCVCECECVVCAWVGEDAVVEGDIWPHYVLTEWKPYPLICERPPALSLPLQLHFSLSINMKSCIPSVDWCWLKHVKGIKEQWELTYRPHAHTRYANCLSAVCICPSARCAPEGASASTQYAGGGGAHNLQNITDNRVEINDLILINA